MWLSNNHAKLKEGTKADLIFLPQNTKKRNNVNALRALNFILVRNEEASGSIPLSSTIFRIAGSRLGSLSRSRIFEERLFKSALRVQVFQSVYINQDA
ncbi:MAG: hypothetical protein WCO61_07290 [Alphaproteobacteria bacterium]